MLRVISLNLNGIRSAARKGFYEWLTAQRADFICMQELKCVGWRIDYRLATPGMAKLARAEAIYKTERFSDHAPLTIDYDFEL